jgi:hypothetical protein
MIDSKISTVFTSVSQSVSSDTITTTMVPTEYTHFRCITYLAIHYECWYSLDKCYHDCDSMDGHLQFHSFSGGQRDTEIDRPTTIHTLQQHYQHITTYSIRVYYHCHHFKCDHSISNTYDIRVSEVNDLSAPSAVSGSQFIWDTDETQSELKKVESYQY